MAVMYGKQVGAPVVLGSATPSLETYANVQAKRYRLLRLLQRPLVDLAYGNRHRYGRGFRREGKQVSVARIA